MYYITAFFYYVLIFPLSLLPMGILYLLSDLFYLIAYYLIGYRKKVVFSNMKRVFPDKSEDEIKELAKEFYKHFCDLMIESVKLFTISRKEAIKRCRVTNPEVYIDHINKGRNVSLVCAHHNNWEMAAVAFPAQFPQNACHIAVIYAPLSNKFFDKVIHKSRSKFGMNLVAKNDTLRFFNTKRDKPSLMAFAADQSPRKSKSNVYWTEFLGQETAVMFGTERYSVRYDYSVVYLHIKKIKRGYYELTFENVVEDPKTVEKGEITSKYTKLMEKDILEQPAYWLWTHNRWKKQKPKED
ncbi:lysophospholipid acyltransferase family protein [Marinigracilibium pacificum]|uniref:Lipid A biosynthesis acyltransferase n=1 Tax=Marinigracilibium pacificum TaxID=2729599 RepID=A0A848JAH2_9BACT|nr:lysophospholipid acyltransferase family protein [Marinigracilibium pacificum]NMM50042.1 lipid A biosynthesis acyltransferase [Marinigracilibium pacificum]